MKSSLLFLFLILCNLVFVSCSEPNTPILGNPNGAFLGNLTMLDSTGSNPLNGKIYIKQDNSTNLGGTWSLDNGRSGEVAGTMNNPRVWINLDPNLIDANTILIGDFDGSLIKGNWYFSGEAGVITGVIDRGTFTATSITPWQPNQSLKLTEPAVDDFAARCWTDLGASDRNVRATNYMELAARRRSLAPVR